MSYEVLNGCVGCPPHLGCMHSACPYRYETHYYCDSCGDDLDPDDLHEYDGHDYCDDCLVAVLEKEGEIEKDPENKGGGHIVDGVHVDDDDLISYLEEMGIIGSVNTYD